MVLLWGVITSLDAGLYTVNVLLATAGSHTRMFRRKLKAYVTLASRVYQLPVTFLEGFDNADSRLAP